MDYFYPFKILYNYVENRKRAKAINTIYSYKQPIKSKPIPSNTEQAKKIRISDL